MKVLLWIIVLASGAIGVVVLSRALLLPSESPSYPSGEVIEIEPQMAARRAQRLAGAVRFRTVSHQDRSRFEPSEFLAFHDYLATTYPLTHATLTRERVADYSLLYRWPGTDPARRPYLLMAHQDVVPVIPGTESDWEQPPFGGEIADGFIWGRGTLDDKVGVTGILDGVEALLESGFLPIRDVYLAFGHDEELGGNKGAQAIANLLAERGVELEYVLDEGGAITDGMLPGLDGTVALVGTAEKGFLSLQLETRAAGGHSSMPPAHTAIGVLSEAVTRLEANPFPADLRYVEEPLSYLAPHMSFKLRLLAANLWLFGPLLDSSRQFNAMVRTTTAVTMFNAGIKENVLPIDARAVVNHRILPGETVETVTRQVTEIIDDPGISVTALTARNPSPVSDATSTSFAVLAATIQQLDEGGIIVVPYLVVGGTDSKHFTDLSTNVYRFNPYLAESDMFQRFHGTNERLAVDAYARVGAFYEQLIRNSDQM